MSIWILGASCVYLDLGGLLCLFGSWGLVVSIWILGASCVYLDLGD